MRPRRQAMHGAGEKWRMKQVGLEQATGQGGPEEALAAFGEKAGDAEAIGFILAPEQTAFVRWQDGTLLDESGSKVDLHRIFELRLFNEAADVRWRRRGSGGEYVLLREVEGDTHWRRETQYLLWGERDRKQPGNDGWVRLSSPQVGSLKVPLRAEGGARRIALRACEYFAAFEDGNIGFVAERLLELAPAGPIHCRGEGK